MVQRSVYLIISGLVQGVGFRAFVEREAEHGNPRAFALPTSGISFTRAAELADLALLAADTARPETTWVNPAVVEAVDQAAHALAPLCSAFAERRQELGRTKARAKPTQSGNTLARVVDDGHARAEVRYVAADRLNGAEFTLIH